MSRILSLLLLFAVGALADSVVVFNEVMYHPAASEPATIETFLRPRLKQLADPFLLPDMDKAVTRLLTARERERVMSASPRTME